MTNKITLEEALKLVTFDQDVDGSWFVHEVHGDVNGNVKGNVWGNVGGFVNGNVGGRVWGNVVQQEDN